MVVDIIFWDSDSLNSSRIKASSNVRDEKESVERQRSKSQTSVNKQTEILTNMCEAPWTKQLHKQQTDSMGTLLKRSQSSTVATQVINGYFCWYNTYPRGRLSFNSVSTGMWCWWLVVDVFYARVL